MVRMAFAAINAAADGDREQQAGETREAQEARVADTYVNALQLLQEQRPADAQARHSCTSSLPTLAPALCLRSHDPGL